MKNGGLRKMLKFDDFEFSEQTTRNAQRLLAKTLVKPYVTCGENGSIAFTWTELYPQKELEIWLFDKPDYYAEWLLVIGKDETEGVSTSEWELLELFRQYLNACMNHSL